MNKNSTHSSFEFQNITVHYPVKAGVVHAVNAVSFSIPSGRAVGLVGESGCGKSSLARALVGLEPMTNGLAHFAGQTLSPQVTAEKLRNWRKNVQLVFQDPNGSINPKFRISEVLGEVLWAQHALKGTACETRVCELLEKVGLPPEMRNRYPHQLSGGQRQRVGIARALAVGAQFLILDEPVSALDVSVQAQIIHLLKVLQTEHLLGYLFVSHDLAVVEYLCQEVMVMYLGHVVESGPAKLLSRNPAHPYTQALVSAIPTPDEGLHSNYKPLHGELPSPLNPPPGCPFATRCPQVHAQCYLSLPPFSLVEEEHFVRCHLFSKLK